MEETALHAATEGAAQSEEDLARASLYALLGALLGAPPEAELLDYVRAFRHESGDHAIGARLRELGAAAAATDPDTLRQEYDDLLIGLGRGEVVPHGSWYRTGFLMDRPLADLRGDLAALGLERQADVHEPEDHAAALCETMSLLITGGGARRGLAVERDFFRRHLEPWMGRFFADLARAEAARFYRAAGGLGETFMAIESESFSMPE